ncbi:cyanate transporter [Tersicoccus solisilvae]|uniref:Cyanate transporter n=1 Tax=Tersicoccus solisilvae TaxID=1882339 RepID=A0ABQ1NTJ3_9MICC|nr:MFS transporter [Tersicoccus solisilvae]GGC84955.1 cyanate transporter [Tersicoccus solisilvae]
MSARTSTNGATTRAAGHLRGRPPAWLLVVGILAIAANLRPIFTALGPLIDQVGAETGVGPTGLGLLAAMPLLAFAVISPVAAAVGNRFGAARTVLAALFLLLVGAGIRSLPTGGLLGEAGLWIGSFLIGAAIAVGNVLLPSIVKREFPGHVPQLTGAYSAVLGAVASVGAGLAVPLSHLRLPDGDEAGWRLGLGTWALLVVPAILLWLPHLRTRTAVDEPAVEPAGDEPGEGERAAAATRPRRSVWRSPLAWQVTAYMGLQSVNFYVIVTWLPTIERSWGHGDVESGWDLFAYQLVGVASSFLVPLLLRGRDQRLPSALAPVFTGGGLMGLLLAPDLATVWALIAGLGGGASLVIALSLIGLRAADHRDASSLSGMSQSVGYLLAAVGPPVVGILFTATGAWTVPVLVLVGVNVVQVVVGLSVGRDRTVGDARDGGAGPRHDGDPLAARQGPAT